jgi:hypothetical protein
VASDELRASWLRTEGFLLEARSHLSEAAEAICADEIDQFNQYIEHNEFELALDMIESAFEKSEFESWRVLELMAFAAANMGLIERQIGYDNTLTKARGWQYQTVLKNAP